jgi:steroid delta-isomerase-like uncharacterized protein
LKSILGVHYAAAMSEVNKALAKQWFEQVWNQKSEATIDRMFHLQRKSHGLPDGNSILVGPDAFKAFHRQVCGALPDIHVDIEDLLVEDDRVAVRWKASGTHLGDHFGFPASGKKAVLTGSSFFVGKGGQILECWNQMDLHSLFQRLQNP